MDTARSLALAIAIASAGCVLGTAAVANRLVLVDGTEVTTRGPWRVADGAVIFHLPNGTLASMRLEAVDLAASGAPAPSGPAALAAPAEPLPASLVITDRDVGRARTPRPGATPRADVGAGGESVPDRPATAEGSDGGDRGDLATDPATAVVISARDLEVANVAVSEDGRGGFEVRGVVVNRGDRVVIEPALSATVRWPGGGEPARYEAQLDADVIAIGRRIAFRVLMPDQTVLTAEDIQFEVEAKAVRPRIVGPVVGGSAGGDEGQPGG